MEKRIILIVDDDDDFRDNMIDILEDVGYTVLSTNRCAKALEIARQSRPGVSLLDIKLPDGSGTDLLRELKEVNEEVICIMLTAFADLKTALEALENGALQYLQKPVHPRELLHVLERAFDTIRLRRDKALAEERLRESEKTVRSLIDAYPDVAVLFDLAGNTISANRKALNALGKGSDRCDDPSTPGWGSREQMERRRQAVQEAGRLEKSVFLEETIGGRLFETIVNPVTNDSGNVDRFAVFSRDITEIRRIDEEKHKLEAVLTHSHKMEAIGTLTGGIAHDFNNLLQSVMGYAQILLMDTTLREIHKQKLRQISNAAERAGDLTRQLLTFSRKVERKPRPLNLNQTIKQVENLLRHTIPRMIALEMNLADDLRTINADPGQMEQVLLNFAVNSRDAMPEGGKFSIRTCNVLLDERFCKDAPELSPGQYVKMTLSDTGLGMKKEVLDRIFEPFFTTKEVGKGTGLGLPMVFGIIKAHQGHIACASVPGQGTVFTLYLPAIVKEGLGWEPEPVTEALIGGSECILVVDDEEAVRDIASITLTHFGYRIIGAADGESAIRLFKQHKNEIGLVILDLIMPGMGGRRCLDELLSIDQDANILVASGFSQEDTPQSLMRAGAKGLIPKPYRIGNLLKTIRKTLDETSQGRPI